MRYEKIHKNLKDCDNNVSIYVVSIDVVVSWLHKKRFFFAMYIFNYRLIITLSSCP